MSESKQPATQEIPAGGMGPHASNADTVLQEEAAVTGTALQADGGMGPHSSATTSDDGGDPITPDGGMGPH
jgi:hypothetical protein